MSDSVDSVPDTAMRVERGDGSETENYVRFPVTDVIEWYTVRSNGEITRERFLSTDPTHPEDVGMVIGG